MTIEADEAHAALRERIADLERDLATAEQAKLDAVSIAETAGYEAKVAREERDGIKARALATIKARDHENLILRDELAIARKEVAEAIRANTCATAALLDAQRAKAEAEERAEGMERAGAEQAGRADENAEIIRSLRARVEPLKGLLRDLVEALEKVHAHPTYQKIFRVARFTGTTMKPDDPEYTQELQAAKQVLAAPGNHQARREAQASRFPQPHREDEEAQGEEL